MPLEIERKWLCTCAPSSWPLDSECYVIQQVYLQDPNDPDKNWRVRKRLGTGDNTSFEEYTMTVKHPVEPGVADEIETVISAQDYHLKLATVADPQRQPIDKVRTVFTHVGRTFEFDQFLGRLTGMYILELEGSWVGEPVELPAWISVGREVTGDVAYSNRELALRK